MADQKIFAGPKIRRLRNELKLTQTNMAKELSISPSYLNLIERNQRPLTVQLLLKLAQNYQIDINTLQTGEEEEAKASLKEVFADPLLAGELPSDSEMIELSEAAPNAAQAMLKLYRAYREGQTRLSDLSQLMAKDGTMTTAPTARIPFDEVRDTFENHSSCFPELEDTASQMVEMLKKTAPNEDLFLQLTQWLKEKHNISVQILPNETMPHWRRRYDRHSQRIFLTERLSRQDCIQELASEAAILAFKERIHDEAEFLNFTSDEAKRLARFELARYVALAMMMPYQPFLAAARRLRYDIEILASRFNVSFAHAAFRLINLHRKPDTGLPFFILELDQAGNILRRAGAAGFPTSRFGGACPKLIVHHAFTVPGSVNAEYVITPENAEFLTVARTVRGPQAGFGERPNRTALLIGLDKGFANETVYGDLISKNKSHANEIGPSCRLCERRGCIARAQPPLTQPLGLDEMVAGLSTFDY